MMAFVDYDEAAATGVGSLLFSISTLEAVVMWMILALVYHTLVTLLAWGGIADLRESGPCWWEVSRIGLKNRKDARSSSRQSRYFQCQRRRNRRRKEQGKPWECPLTRLHNHFSNMPPPLPFHRRRPCCPQTESDANSPIATKESQEALTKSPAKSPQNNPPTRFIISSSPTAQTPAIDLARMQQWSRLIDRVTSHRREARQVDSDGLMPLHWACSGGPTLEVIEALLKAYPRASKRTDNEGSTALHFACHYGGSAPVVRSLLEAYPKAVYKKDKYGRTPLYHAVAKSSSLDVIRILIQADPSMAIEPCLPPKSSKLEGTSHDNRPLYHRTPLFMAWAAVTSSPHTRRRRRNGKAWEKAELVLEAAYRETAAIKPTMTKDQFTFLMLHSVIKLDSYLPPHAIHLALERFPDQLRQPDELDGRLPLAIATGSQSPRAQEMIKLLCEAYPQAARVSDANGQTPLAIALASGRQWDQGVKTVFDAAPDVLTRRDRKTRLYPSLVAASTDITNEAARFTSSEQNNTHTTLVTIGSPKDKASNWRSQVLPNVNTGNQTEPPSTWTQVDAESSHLSTIYELVRAGPSLVKW